eukprot:tig00000133_g7692.t1
MSEQRLVVGNPRNSAAGGCGERAAVVSRQALAASAQQLIAASASGVGVPAGRGALRLMEVAALVLAAALKAGNERLSLTMAADKYARLFAHADAPAALALQLLHRHRVDSPLLAAPTAHPARFSLVALLGLPRPARSARPAALPALVHIPELLSSLVSNAPLDVGQACLAAAVVLPEPPMGAPAGAPLARCSAAGWRRRLAPPGCTGAATGPRAHPSEHAAQLSHASAGKELYLG